MVYVFDIECYTNFFSVIFKNIKTLDIHTFVINEVGSNLEILNIFINDREKWFVGYNSTYYDNQMLNYISKQYQNLSKQSNDKVCNLLKELSDSIIKDDTNNYKYNLPFKGIDLMRVGNLDMKPLKLVAVNLKWPKIQDLPIEPDALIEVDQFDLLLKYNLNDVEITEALYNKLLKEIKLRWDISKEYNVNCIDESDSGISNKLLEKIFSEALDIPIKILKESQTNRSSIKFEDVVFSDIKFRTPILQDLLRRVKSQTYIEGISKFSEKIIFGGTAYQLGVGGIHSDDRPGLFTATDDTELIDADIASMYPSLIINKRLSPEHLGDGFIDKYSEIRDVRLIAKKNKDAVKNDALKIVLNATYGKTNSKTHWLRDTLVTLRTTVNGQLYLMMLIEALYLKGFQVISANTDGIVTIVPKDRKEIYLTTCSTWEQETNFELEYTDYLKYARRDVNNYITIKPWEDWMKPGQNIKLKGDFEIKTPLQKGFNAPIVSIALYEYYVNGIDIEETIKNHKDIYDFCIARKSDKKFTNEYHYLKDGKDHVIEELQRTNRYYISTNGGKLYKHDKTINKLVDVSVGYNLTIFNDYVESDDYNINYGYYISRARKIKDLVENPQLSLF